MPCFHLLTDTNATQGNTQCGNESIQSTINCRFNELSSLNMLLSLEMVFRFLDFHCKVFWKVSTRVHLDIKIKLNKNIIISWFFILTIAIL